jgi:hypothetical protein
VAESTPASTCRTCRATKPDADFYVTRHGKPFANCKRCHNLAVVARRRFVRSMSPTLPPGSSKGPRSAAVEDAGRVFPF